MTKLISIGFSIIVFMSCVKNSKSIDIEYWKNEILQTEKDFAEMVKSDGLHKAFVFYAADNAVLMRNDELVIGKNNIDLLYKNQTATGLTWTPDYIDVANSGDLGYTYGKYTYSFIDTNGDENESSGVFHTVWKRQSDGKWKFVWD